MINENIQMRSGGGTPLLTDGTAKWEVRKLGNAEELNGQAIEDFKNELLAAVPETSKVALVTGIINRSGTMPLPSGYTREQCKYCAWLDRIDGSSSANFHCSIDQSSGTIVGHVSNGNIPGSYAVIFGYLCIAVK